MSFFKDWQQKRRLKKELFGFLNEVNKNLETYFVMDQRQTVEYPFVEDRWSVIKERMQVQFDETVDTYSKEIHEYNEKLSDYKTYEKWYSSDSKNKTKENGAKLHKKKLEVRMKFKGLDQVIIPAQHKVVDKLVELGFVKE